MQHETVRILEEGRKVLDPIMEANGFQWEFGGVGHGGSGGTAAWGYYTKGNRKLDMHFRRTLGLVFYHIGRVSLSHEDYMRHVAEERGAKYPGFSTDPLGAFQHLAHDLKNFAADFLSGDGGDLLAAKAKSEERSKLSGFSKLTRD